MPTNYLRRGSQTPPAASQLTGSGAVARTGRLVIGGVRLDVAFDATQSAERIHAALPLHSIAETWGDSIHFEIPIRGGRDRTARLNAEIGGLYYWAEEERLILVFGQTPISGNGVIRLPRPCNVLGMVAGDFTALAGVHPGQKVVLSRD